MSLIEKIVKPEIKSLVRIKDTDEHREEYLRLDKKERLVPFNEELFTQLTKGLSFEDFACYYELEPTYRKLADYLGVKREQLLLASGSDLSIKSVYEACIEKGDHIVLHAPGYAMFFVYADMFGAEYTRVPVQKDWNIDAEAMLKAVTEKTKLVVVENPNGFVGTIPSDEAIEHLASELLKKNVLLLIDEAYYYVDHTTSTSHKLIEKYPNVIITQTLSKMHGLAGVRIGYLIGNAELMEYIQRVRPMHEITSISAITAQWVIEHPVLLEEYRQVLRENKVYLIEELKKLNIEAKTSHANFVLVYLPNEGKTENIQEKLKEHKILVRRPFTEPFLEGWMLVCVGPKDAMDQFLNAIKSIIG